MKPSSLFGFALTLFLIARSTICFASEPIVIDLWPDDPPGKSVSLPPEADLTKPEDRLIAGRRIIKLGNVANPQIAIYRPAAAIDTGVSVLICPGGGHHILAYDLEGTEVAQWLNQIGVTGIVLKYRVPFRNKDQRWKAAVQDAQRAMSLIRHHASKWSLDVNRMGICGFSAGGQTAALTSTFLENRQYQPIDEIDTSSSRPNFGMLIYSGGLVPKGRVELEDFVKVSSESPPMFLVHAFDDHASVHNSLSFATALKEADVSTELHVFPTGGHGYGLRPTSEPVTRWPVLARAWMERMEFIPSSKQDATKKDLN